MPHDNASENFRVHLRFDGDVVWAAVGGDRLEVPAFSVDVDLIYAHATGGFEVAQDFFVTGGVRRVALDFDIRLANQSPFSREPGLWNPLVGVGWHRKGTRMEWHGIVEGGGFGVGADVDFGAALRFDWKPLRVFGITAGYNFLYLKASNTVRERGFDSVGIVRTLKMSSVMAYCPPVSARVSLRFPPPAAT